MKYKLFRRDRHGRPIEIGDLESLEDALHRQAREMEAASKTKDRAGAFIIMDENMNEIV